MPDSNARNPLTEAWPGLASAALRVAFGVIWAMDAALTWTSGFAAHYVGYLHNASHGQPGWSAWWFDMWIALVTPRAELFVWLTRSAETALALALILGFARKSTYLVGTLFSLLIWSTAEGFGGPYTVGATNMGTAISYVLIFIALIVIDHRAGPNPYSIDYLIERRWPRWRRIAEWNRNALPQPAHRLSWRAQASALGGIALLLVLLLAGLHSALNVKSPSPVAAAAAVSPRCRRMRTCHAPVTRTRYRRSQVGDCALAASRGGNAWWVLMAIRFQTLMAQIVISNRTISFLSKRRATPSQTASGTPASPMRVTDSVSSSAACSRSVKNDGASRQAERMSSRRCSTPAARASAACMSRQNAQPFSCDARSLTKTANA
jgi:uncharacterized membrane protein YphA (DoxX/SURF4 family)